MAQVILTLARDNRFNDVRKAVTAGLSPVGFSNQIGQTALHIAALHGNLETIEVLLELGIDVNVQNQRGSTPLSFAAAAKKNASATCKMLLKAGADPNLYDSMGMLPYERADDDDLRLLLGGPDPKIFEYAKQGKEAELRQLIEKSGKEVVHKADEDNATVLHVAAAAGHAEIVKMVLGYGAEVNTRGEHGNFPLHEAVKEGHTEIVKILLEAGADPKMPNMRLTDYTNGQWLSRDNKETLEPFDQTPLHLAAETGDTEIAEMLLKAGAKVNFADFDGTTPLHVALEENDKKMLDLLLAQEGVDVNVGNGDFESPLHYLASKGRAALIPRLAGMGADVNKANKEGWTPLHLAARTPKVEALQALLDAGCDPLLVNSTGSTALHLAAVNGRTQNVQLLKDFSRDACEIKNADGYTPAQATKSDEVRAILEG